MAHLAPIGQKAQPAADRGACEAADAVSELLWDILMLVNPPT
jgi:hypothetical protein